MAPCEAPLACKSLDPPDAIRCRFADREPKPRAQQRDLLWLVSNFGIALVLAGLGRHPSAEGHRRSFGFDFEFVTSS